MGDAPLSSVIMESDMYSNINRPADSIPEWVIDLIVSRIQLEDVAREGGIARDYFTGAVTRVVPDYTELSLRVLTPEGEPVLGGLAQNVPFDGRCFILFGREGHEGGFGPDPDNMSVYVSSDSSVRTHDEIKRDAAWEVARRCEVACLICPEFFEDIFKDSPDFS